MLITYYVLTWALDKFSTEVANITVLSYKVIFIGLDSRKFSTRSAGEEKYNCASANDRLIFSFTADTTNFCLAGFVMSVPQCKNLKHRVLKFRCSSTVITF